MDESDYDVNVVFEDLQDVSVDLNALRELALSVLRAEGYPPGSEISVTLVGDARMAEMNHQYLGMEGPTDVLSFPLVGLEPGVPPVVAPSSPPLCLGDVLIAPAFVARQAIEFEVQFSDEIALMLVHGILHLMGYDHSEDSDAEIMETRERSLLSAAEIKRR